VHFKPADIPLIGKDSNGGHVMRSIKAGDMEIGASWIECPMDPTDLYEGFPGNGCPVEHYGYVFSGSIRVKYNDGTEELINEGEVYYIPGGHMLSYDGPTYHLEINPHKQLRQVMDHLNAKMAERDAAKADEEK
jgi:hypothetical protein